MNDQSHIGSDNIPVLSEVVVPDMFRVDTEPEPVPSLTAHDHALTERLSARATMLLTEMQDRIERMVEEEMTRAHTSALETARLALQQRLSTEMEAFISDALRTLD